MQPIKNNAKMHEMIMMPNTQAESNAKRSLKPISSRKKKKN